MTRRYWPLGQLIIARLREFYREPEAIFWVYGFPIVMVVLLGVAFRNKPVDQVRVDIVDNPLAEKTKDALAKGAASQKSSSPRFTTIRRPSSGGGPARPIWLSSRRRLAS